MNHMLFNPPWSIPDETLLYDRIKFQFCVFDNFEKTKNKKTSEKSAWWIGELNFKSELLPSGSSPLFLLLGQSMIWFGLERRTERPIETAIKHHKNYYKINNTFVIHHFCILSNFQLSKSLIKIITMTYLDLEQWLSSDRLDCNK